MRGWQSGEAKEAQALGARASEEDELVSYLICWKAGKMSAKVGENMKQVRV